MLGHKDLIDQMSVEIGMLPKHLENIIRTAPLRYKVFYIKKRSGGLREVAQPAREVKAIQRWLLKKIEPNLPIHPAATAYKAGSSIKHNALQHVGSNYLLKLDFCNFFPSISEQDISQHLQRYCSSIYDASAIKLISHVSCWAANRRRPLSLCIGAPSSPLLSNSLMYEFDVQLKAITEADQAIYTRYADDIAISSKKFEPLDKYKEIVENIASKIEYPHLIVNTKKTVFASRAGRRVLTGITLTPDLKLSIGRERKRLIRAMYHRSIFGQLSLEEQQKLSGLLAFADNIEPGFSARLKKKS